MRLNKVILTLFILVVPAIAWSQTSQFQFRRQLEGINETWHEIILDAHVLENANNDLSDLRLLGFNKEKDTVEAPFLVEISKEQISQEKQPFTLLNQAERNGSSFFTFRVDDARIINQIQLSFANHNFDWRIQLQAGNNQNEWYTLLDDYRILDISNEQVNYSFTKLIFQDAQYNYFRIKINSPDAQINTANISYLKKIDEALQNYDVASFEIIQRDEQKETVAVLQIPFNLPISNVFIDINADFDFHRPYVLDYLFDSTLVTTDDGEGWVYHYRKITSGILTSMEDNIIKFDPVKCKRIRLTISNNDNAEIPITGIHAAGPVYTLIARFDKSIGYYLHYGNRTLSPPNYDIKYFSDKIPVNITKLVLGELETLKDTSQHADQTGLTNKWWLWGIMIIIILILGWYSMKMIKS